MLNLQIYKIKRYQNHEQIETAVTGSNSYKKSIIIYRIHEKIESADL